MKPTFTFQNQTFLLDDLLTAEDARDELESFAVREYSRKYTSAYIQGGDKKNYIQR